MKSWNEEINWTMQKANASFDQVPQWPAHIKLDWQDGKRQIFRRESDVYVIGQDATGRATTHFVDKDTWRVATRAKLSQGT